MAWSLLKPPLHTHKAETKATQALCCDLRSRSLASCALPASMFMYARAHAMVRSTPREREKPYKLIRL
eukprot:360997-Chlamydomonas_euryale.AAC.2